MFVEGNEICVIVAQVVKSRQAMIPTYAPWEVVHENNHPRENSPNIPPVTIMVMVKENSTNEGFEIWVH